MTHNEIVELLEEVGIPLAYHHFAEGEAPEPPFLCFLFPREKEFGADNVVYHSFHEVDIEVYTDLKNPELEAKVERVLNAHEIFYHKSETWIEDEKLYEVLYEATL